MAYFIILPDGVTGTNEWSNTGSPSHSESVQSDDDDTTFIYETRQGHEITLTMANPGPIVSEASIDFDEDISVRTFVTAHYEGGSGTVDMDIKVTGTGITLAAQTVNVAVDSSYPTYVGLTNAQKALGSDWDYAGLENAQVYLECTSRPDRFSSLRVSYVFIRVDYTAAVVVVADNATFFGANF